MIELNWLFLQNKKYLPIKPNGIYYNRIEPLSDYLLLCEGKYYLLEEFSPPSQCNQCLLENHNCEDFYLFNSDFSKGIILSCNGIELTEVKDRRICLAKQLENKIIKLYRR